MPAASEAVADRRRSAVLTDTLPRLFVALSAPALLVTGLNGLNVLIDMVYAGHLIGTDAVAALGVVQTLNHMVFSFEALIAAGAAATLSVAIGVGDRETERATFTAVLLLSAMVGAALVAAGVLVVPAVLAFLGLHDRTLTMGWAYYRVYLAGSVVVIYAFCTGALLQARGELPRMAANQAAGIATTAVVTPLLMGPAGLGLPGAAVGTIVGAFVAAALNTASLRRGQIGGFVWPSRTLIGRILSVGQSGMLMQLSYFAQGFLVFWSLARLGAERDLAFMGATYRLVLFGVYLATGFSRALQPVAGINYGAGNGRRVAHAFLIFNAGALAVLAGPWLAAMLSPSMVLRLVAPGLIVSAADAGNFRTYVSVLLLMPFLLTSLTLYQAIGLQWQVTAFGLIRLLVFFVPAILLAPRWFGLSGVYDALAVMDIALAAILVVNAVVTVRPRLARLSIGPGMAPALSVTQQR